MKDACQAPDFAPDIAPDMCCFFVVRALEVVFYTCQAPDIEPDHALDMYWYTTYNIKSDDVILVLVIKQVMALMKRSVLVVMFVEPLQLVFNGFFNML